ncbi:MAG: hypothetical protein RLZ75_2308 [Pseudomonadota bacterium]|jgi:hypothetical protein
MQIFKYLENIKSGKPVNFDVFCKKLNIEGYDDLAILKVFATKKISKSSYQVNIINESLFSKLAKKYPNYTISNRVSAAQSGDSHKHTVSQAMIMLWPNQQTHPVVILNDINGIKAPVALGQKLLIIENQENFVKKDESLSFLKHEFPEFNENGLDVAWGSGNSISNRLNKAFFNHYQHIDCLLDLDMGGLTTFVNLVKLTTHPRLNFLLPPCADALLKQSKIHLENKHRVDLCAFKENYPQLLHAIELMMHHKKMLEQEMYLQD